MKKIFYTFLLISPLLFICSCEDDAQEDVGSTYEIGDIAEGGVIFYYDNTNQRGLVLANEEIGVYNWGCAAGFMDYIDYEGANLHSVGSGLQNTLEIISQCDNPNSAANICYDYVSDPLVGYDDWYLPSINELKLIRDNYYTSSVEMEYWSSTRHSNQNFGENIVTALYLEMWSGDVVPYIGFNELGVIPIRRFGDWSNFEIGGCTDENASNFQISAEINDNTCCYNCYFTNSLEFYGNYCGDDVIELHNSFQEGVFQQYINDVPQFNDDGQPIMINLSGIISCEL